MAEAGIAPVASGQATTQPSVTRGLWSLAGICLVLIVVGYLFFVVPVSGHDIDAGAYFGRSAVERRVATMDGGLLKSVSIATYGLALLVIVVIGTRCHSWKVGLIAAFASGCAVVAAEVLKFFLPWQHLIPQDSNYATSLQKDTYPSGHTTLGTSLALALIVVSPMIWRRWVGVAAGFVSASIATAVVIMGWHRGSDALAAIALSGLVMSVAAISCVALVGVQLVPTRAQRGPRVASIVVALLFLAVIVLSVANLADEYPDADGPFVAMMALIVTFAFGLTAIVGWLLSGFEWPQSPPAKSRRRS